MIVKYFQLILYQILLQTHKVSLRGILLSINLDSVIIFDFIFLLIIF